MKLLSLCCAWSIASAAIVGIDLGHRFTKAMMVAPGIRFEIIPTDGGNRKDLSAIYVEPKVSEGSLEDAQRAYGSQIGSLCSRSSNSCAANLKSLLGKTFNDPWVEMYLTKNPHFNIVSSQERSDAVVFELGPSGNTFTFSVEELAAMSLADLKERVIKALTHHPQARAIAEDVAISVPPFANQISRLAFKDALSLANFTSVLGLVDEGCAAALAYVSDKKFSPEEYNGKTMHHVIYDVGAGSTTATLFSFTPFENKTVLLDVESVGFDDSLGGDLLTQKVYDILYSKLLQEFGLEASFEMPFKMKARLMESAEKARTILSANAESKVSLESFYNDADFKTTISREEYENSTFELIDRINQPIFDALKSSPTGFSDISAIESVILNGGTTRTPFIQKQLVSLLGEGKISKALNADEACAYGTTIRAYQLKMITGTGSDIILNDRILSDFEITINGTSERQVIFEKGSSAGNSTVVKLGKIFGNTSVVGLHENGELFGSYNITRLGPRISDLTCATNDVGLYGQFTVGHDKLVALNNLYLKCETDPKNDIEGTEETNSTNLNSTVKKVIKSKVKVAVPAFNFARLRPYTFSEKRNFLSTLKNLKVLEEKKLIFEHSRNLLESACYSLRSYIDDNFDVLSDTLSESELEIIQNNTSDMLEWVDYESESATLELLKNKLDSVKKIRKQLESSLKMSSADLSFSAIKDLLDEGNELAQTVQDYLLEFGSQTKQVRVKYENEGFDFDSENEKIMKKIYGVKSLDKFELEEHFLEFKEALKSLSQMTNVAKSKFEKVPQQKRFDASEAVNDLTRSMVSDVQILQTQHEERLTYLLNRLDKLRERKMQKDLKAKLKEEREKEKAENASSVSISETAIAHNTTEADSLDSQNQNKTVYTDKSTDGSEDPEQDKRGVKSKDQHGDHDEL